MRTRPALPHSDRFAAYRQLWRGCATAKVAIAEAICLALLLQLTRMLPALGLALVIDKVATSHAEATLIAILAALGLAAGLEHQLAAGREAVTREIADRIEAGMPVEADESATTRRPATSPTSLAHVAAELLLVVVATPPMAAVMILALIFASPPLALLATGATAVHVAIDRLGRGRRDQANAAARAAATAQDRWRTQSAIALALDGDDRARDETRRRVLSLATAQQRSQDALDAIRKGQGRIGTLLQRAGYVAALGLGAQAIAAGTLTTGGLIAALMILRQLETLIGASITVLHRAEAMAPKPVQRVTSDAAPPSPTLALPRGGISLRDAVLRFEDGTAPALRVSLDIAPGSFVVVTGAAGAGKSLLLRMIAGALRPHSGAVLRASARLAPVAFVGEDPTLPDATIAEAVLAGSTAAAHAARLEALRQAGALEAIRALPQGLTQTTGLGGRALSSTLRRRVALARALATRPAILLIDALPDRLDDESAVRLLAALVALRGRLTLIVATQRVDWQAAADRCLALRAGRVIADGPDERREAGHVRSA